MSERTAGIPPGVRRTLRAALPDVDLDRATVLGEGWGAIAYRLPGPGTDFVLRVPKPGSWWAVRDLEHEARLLPALEQWGLPVPRASRLLRDDAGNALGAVQSLIEGTPASSLPRSAALRRRYAEALATFFVQLHSFSTSRASELGIRAPHMWLEHYEPLVERCKTLLPPASRRWLDERARRFLAEGGVQSAPAALIHADVSADHLLVDAEWRLRGVIDWGDAMVGDPALDFAGLLNDYPWRFVDAVLEAYRARGGPADPDLRRRARFYIEVAPIFGVLFGNDAGFPDIAARDRRRFAALAGASTRGSPRAAR